MLKNIFGSKEPTIITLPKEDAARVKLSQVDKIIEIDYDAETMRLNPVLSYAATSKAGSPRGLFLPEKIAFCGGMYCSSRPDTNIEPFLNLVVHGRKIKNVPGTKLEPALDEEGNYIFEDEETLPQVGLRFMRNRNTDLYLTAYDKTGAVSHMPVKKSDSDSRDYIDVSTEWTGFETYVTDKLTEKVATEREALKALPEEERENFPTPWLDLWNRIPQYTAPPSSEEKKTVAQDAALDAKDVGKSLKNLANKMAEDTPEESSEEDPTAGAPTTRRSSKK
jgi:hypothetical protein